MTLKVLDYHDVLLYDSDLNLLEGQEWLNDQVISFYFEYLAREKYDARNFCFVPGATTFLLTNAGVGDAAEVAKSLKGPVFRSLKARLHPGQLTEQDLVLLAVNNNPDVTTACGGSHWSLLVLDLPRSEARHYDSAHGANAAVAAELFKKLKAPLGWGAGAKLVLAPAPQQRNAYDCGVYVLAMADALCGARARGLPWAQADAEVLEALPPGAARTWRSDLLVLAHELAGTGRRQ